MKIKNLIEELQKLDPELVAVRPGYEGGYCEVAKFVIEDMVKDYHSEPWYGPHEAVSVVNFLEPHQKGDFAGLIIL